MIDLDELMALLIDVPETRSRNVVTKALIAELRAARKVATLAATIIDHRTPSDWHALGVALDELEALK